MIWHQAMEFWLLTVWAIYAILVSMPKSEEIERLRSSKDPEDRRSCIPLLKKHLSAEPDDAEAWFDLASCHDFLGEEPLAEPAYAKALSLGVSKLPGPKQVRLIIQYGSTLRNNKKLEDAKEVLMDGLNQFPESRALKVFAAFSLFSLGEYQESSRLLFLACASLPPDQLDGYNGAIKFYAENLDSLPK